MSLLRPEDVWPVAAGYEGSYATACYRGREVAATSGLNVVAIARNAAKLLPNTMGLVHELRETFSRFQAFVFENDSTDETATMLDTYRKSWGWMDCSHETWGGCDSRGFERERTERLAKARNVCLEWVRQHGTSNEYTMVVDVDPDHGFSVAGVMNSLGHLADGDAGGMASYSLLRIDNGDGTVGLAHYDAWAARLNWWEDRREEVGGMNWFLSFFPPVGSPPFPMNSAFGGLCVYRTEAFLSGGYSGEDCEHVTHHRRMAAAGWRLYFNPGSRYVAIWR